MTDPVLSLEPARVSVQPDGQARVVLTISNPGTIVEGYRVDLVDEVSSGDGRIAGPARWSHVLVAEGPEHSGAPQAAVSIYPQQRQDVVIVFSPGTGPEVPGGAFAFGVRVVSLVDPSASAVVEGEVEIGQVYGLLAKIVPVNSTGRWSGKHVVQISNWGNAPMRLRLTPSDPDLALGYLVRPDVVDVPLGGSVSARVRVRTRRPRLRGQVARLPFTIAGEQVSPMVHPSPVSTAADPGRFVVDGAFSQKAILSRLVVAGAALALVGALAVGGIAFTRRAPEPPQQGFGVPQTPVLAPAVPVSASQIKLAWVPQSNVSGYELYHLAQGSNAVERVEKLDKAVGAHQVESLDPGREYCFQLKSLRGQVSSPLSKRSCAKTKPKPVTPTPVRPTPGTTSTTSTTTTTTPTPPPGRTSTTTGGPPVVAFAATDWIAMVYVRPSSAPGAEEQAMALRSALAAKKVDAKVLLSSAYPKLTPTFVIPSWVVYLGPFPSSATAISACAKVQDSTAPMEDCLPSQPAP